jgi:trehalose 6-phosphate synthase/phosphatase
VVEIRHAGVDKGSAALSWLANGEYDFILGIGDDTTDEDMFKSMPADAVTIRVGISATLAKYTLLSHGDVIELLHALIASTKPSSTLQQ